MTAPGGRSAGRPGSVLPSLLALVAGASLILHGLAVTASRDGAFGLGLALYFSALVAPFLLGVAVLLRPGLPERARRAVLVVIGVTPTVVFRLTDPLLLTAFDEQLHLRTLNDLLNGAPLFSPNPLLSASPNYPGLELLTLAVQRSLNLPTMLAVTIVVLLCRVILVLAIYELAVILTRDRRSAALVVVLYAASPQFYLFNSMYAYQTLALSLVVGGLLLLCRAVQGRHPDLRQAFGAVLCFAAATVTHHLTSWVTVAVLLGWGLLAPKRHRRVVLTVAGVSAAMVVVWAIPMASRLRDYLGPVFGTALDQLTGVASGEQRRTVFVDSAGASTPPWERVTMIAYVAAVTITAIVTGLIILRRTLAGRNRMLFVLGVLCLAYPATYAARLSAQAAEISDRVTTFAFLPLALGVALLAGTRMRRVGTGSWWAAAAIVLLSGLGYLGGVLLGSGPDWARLPGNYLVVADSRSLDPETLAAVAWSRDNLPPGATIMADRMPATLLSSTARLWVEHRPRPGLEPATLYFSPTWGPEHTRIARTLGLRYLYVDSRLSQTLPHRDWYFYPGETPDRRQLSAPALDKFTAVAGITTAYRHGPVAIYDLRGLGVDAPPRGWVGDWRMDPWRDAGWGLLGAALLGWRWRRAGHRSRPALGGVATACVAVAALVLLTALATAVGFRPGWLFLAGLAGPVLLAVGLRRLGRRPDPAARSRPARGGDVAAVLAVATVLAAIGVGLAVRSAWIADHREVARILTAVRDP